MFALFEEAGKFQAGRVLSEADSSVAGRAGQRQARQGQGRQHPAEVRQARAGRAAARGAGAGRRPSSWTWPGNSRPKRNSASPTWRATISATTPSLAQQAAALLRLFEAPHYFRRAGKGRFARRRPKSCSRRWPRIEKKKQVQAQIAAWAAELVAGSCPAPIREQLFKILFKPDKNAPEYKAVVEASRARAARAAGPAASAPAPSTRPTSSTGSASCSSNFPKGTAFPPLAAPAIKDDAAAGARSQAFSIDDSSTTEIDDALSVQGLGTGTVTRRHPHRRAGRWRCSPPRRIDQVARQRLSTVYMPGYKITMLPDDVVQAYTLPEGRDCPAVSLYVTLRRGRRWRSEVDAKRGWSACRSRPTCATTSSTRVVTEAMAAKPAPDGRRRAIAASRAAGLPVPPGAAPEVAARSGARQARELQPARLQLQRRAATMAPSPTATSRCRSACASAARRWT